MCALKLTSEQMENLKTKDQFGESESIISLRQTLSGYETGRRLGILDARSAQKEIDIQHKKLTKRHYRLSYDGELEKNTDLFPKPIFTNIDIMRGQSRGINKTPFGFLNPKKHDASGELSSEKSVGRFKGLITVQNAEEIAEYEATKDEKTKKIWEHL